MCRIVQMPRAQLARIRFERPVVRVGACNEPTKVIAPGHTLREAYRAGVDVQPVGQPLDGRVCVRHPRNSLTPHRPPRRVMVGARKEVHESGVDFAVEALEEPLREHPERRGLGDREGVDQLHTTHSTVLGVAANERWVWQAVDEECPVATVAELDRFACGARHELCILSGHTSGARKCLAHDGRDGWISLVVWRWISNHEKKLRSLSAM